METAALHAKSLSVGAEVVELRMVANDGRLLAQTDGFDWNDHYDHYDHQEQI